MPNSSAPKGISAQQELFAKDSWGVHKCSKCGSLGTIVEMGQCCRIAQLAAIDRLQTERYKNDL